MLAHGDRSHDGKGGAVITILVGFAIGAALVGIAWFVSSRAGRQWDFTAIYLGVEALGAGQDEVLTLLREQKEDFMTAVDDLKTAVALVHDKDTALEAKVDLLIESHVTIKTELATISAQLVAAQAALTAGGSSADTSVAITDAMLSLNAIGTSLTAEAAKVDAELAPAAPAPALDSPPPAEPPVAPTV